MSGIAILVDSCSGKNKNNVKIHFMNMLKEVVFFGTYTYHFYINGHTSSDYNRAFNILKVLYLKQKVFTFDNYCEFLNARNNFEVIQMIHENFFGLE